MTPQKSTTTLPLEIVAFVAAAQRRLIRRRRRYGLPRDPRSERNLKMIERQLGNRG